MRVFIDAHELAPAEGLSWFDALIVEADAGGGQGRAKVLHVDSGLDLRRPVGRDDFECD